MSNKNISLLPDNALTEVSSKAYDDLAQKPFSTIGKLAQDVLKFVALPISCLGLTAEQLEIKYKNFIESALNKVEDDDMISTRPSPALIAPVLEGVKYIFDDKPLYEMFENLLASAFCKSKKEIAHPMFVNTLRQLSPYDAVLLRKIYLHLSEDLFNHIRGMSALTKGNIITGIKNYFFPVDDSEKYHQQLYSIGILEHLNLIIADEVDEEYEQRESIDEEVQILLNSDFIKKMRLKEEFSLGKIYPCFLGFTPYGRQFVKCCMREEICKEINIE